MNDDGTTAADVFADDKVIRNDESAHTDPLGNMR
jgi:hypothetical protein